MKWTALLVVILTCPLWLVGLIAGAAWRLMQIGWKTGYNFFSDG